MPGGVIDEFLIKIGMEGDPSGLIDAYKQLMAQQGQYEQKTQEWDQQENQNDSKKQKRAQNFQKFQAGLNTAVGKGVDLGKKGVSMARNWAVALLAVDGAALAVVGRLSQMAVEYANLAGATNTSASELKAWEDTFKSAGGKAGDVQSSMAALYERAFSITQEGTADPGTMRALASFGVTTHEGGVQRETGDIFADVIEGYRASIEGGMDKNMALGLLKNLGISGELSRPMLSTDESGEYRINEELFEKFLGLAQPLDDLADASLGLTGIITELSATFRDKFARVLLELVESGVLEDMLTKLTAFVAELDTEKIAQVVGDLIGALETLFNWIMLFIPGSGAQKEYQENLNATVESLARRDALLSAIGGASTGKEYRAFAGFAGYGGSARGSGTEGGRQIAESEALSRANEMGLNISQIFSQAGLPALNNKIDIYIDGKNIPYDSEEYQSYSGNAAAVDSGIQQ